MLTRVLLWLSWLWLPASAISLFPTLRTTTTLPGSCIRRGLCCNGWQRHCERRHEPDKASYRSEVATMGSTSDNLALFAYYGSGGITLMRNALETGAFSTFIGADGMLSQETIDQIGGENMGAATFTTSASDPSRDAFQAWAALAEAAGVPASDPFVANSYDAAFMMALAIEAAGSADRDGIAAGLRAISGPTAKPSCRVNSPRRRKSSLLVVPSTTTVVPAHRTSTVTATLLVSSARTLSCRRFRDQADHWLQVLRP